MRKRTRIAVIALVAMLGFAGAGIAWAWFSSTTTATASGGAAGSLAALTPGGTQYVYETGQTALYPNHAADVRLQITNGNQVPVEIVSVVPGAKSTTTPGCDAFLVTSVAGGYVIEGASPANNLVIAAGATVVLNITDGVAMDDDADNSCAGTGFSTSWTINVENR